MSDEEQAATNGHSEPPAGQVAVTITMTPDAHGHVMSLNFPPNMYADDLVSICRRAMLYFERVALVQHMNDATKKALAQRSEIVRAIGGRDPRGLMS